jgi:hypothetical protein
MPEENNAAGQDAGEEKQDAGTEQKPAATDTGKEDAGAGEAAEEKGEKDTSKDQNAKVPPKETQPEADDNAEPAVRQRMSPKDFIIQRQQRKIAKMREQEGSGEEGAGEPEEIAPEDEALITSVVARKFAPIFEKTLAAEDDKEISAFVKANPDFAPFEAKARRFISHPSRQHLPVESVFYEVAGKQLLKMGADRGRQADEAAKQTQTGGGSNRGGGGEKTAWDLSKEEFEAKKEKVRRGQ